MVCEDGNVVTPKLMKLLLLQDMHLQIYALSNDGGAHLLTVWIMVTIKQSYDSAKCRGVSPTM